MQLTRAADYAVRVMIHMAALPLGTRTSRTQLAIAAGCPEQFLSKVLQDLTRAGLVNSHRGNTGGFELPRSAGGVSLLEVVEAVEGPIHLNVCLAGTECDRKSWCPARTVWERAQEALTGVLRSTSIADMAKSGRQWN